MYICICKKITDKQLKCAIVEEGLCSRKQLRECLGLGSQCGKCNRHVKQFLSPVEASNTAVNQALVG